MPRRSWLAALALALVAPAALASTTRAERAPLRDVASLEPSEKVSLALTSTGEGASRFTLELRGDELTRGHATAPRALDGVSLLAEDTLKVDVAPALAPSLSETRIRVFEFLGTPLVGVERGVTLEVRWPSARFSFETASGSREDPLGLCNGAWATCLADWVDTKTNVAAAELRGSVSLGLAEHPVLSQEVNALIDRGVNSIKNVVDPLRFGNSIGERLSLGGDTHDILMDVSKDLGRGSHLLLTLATMGRGSAESAAEGAAQDPSPERRQRMRDAQGRYAPEPNDGPERHSRDTDYPHDFRSGVRDEIIKANTNDRGEVIDPATGRAIPRDKATIEHKEKVVEHWNSRGHDETREQRADWFNDKDNLTVKPKEENCREGAQCGQTFRQDTGPKYQKN
jgi:hypothetical protein